MLENEGMWISVLHENCSRICELEVRLLNHSNWTSITQVMVRFLGLPQAALFLPNPSFRFLGLIFSWEKVRIWTSILQLNCSSI